MSITRPPKLTPLAEITGEQLEAYQPFNRILDDKGRYLPFDQFVYRVKSGINADLAWSFTRRARNAALTRIDYENENGEQAGFCLTPAVLETCELVDKHLTPSPMQEKTDRLREIGAALAQLRMDEAITSSQLEGANTTTLVARQMLESGRKARTEGEQMIVGNARLMAEIPEHLGEPLTIDLIQRLHSVGMSGINDESYTPGTFRQTDDIVIADYDGNVVHKPPLAASIPGRLERVCDWVNDTTSGYIHPLVKACALHFMMAHEHPFRDGNGRTSRALFYWFMMKSGYEGVRYISISSLLHGAASRYAFSYQYTETDGMDLTYFLDYQASIVKRAVEKLNHHIDAIICQRATVDKMLYDSGLLSKLSSRQVSLFNVMMAETGKPFTVAEVAAMMGVSDNTARSDLKALLLNGLVNAQNTTWQQTQYLVPSLREVVKRVSGS